MFVAYMLINILSKIKHNFLNGKQPTTHRSCCSTKIVFILIWYILRGIRILKRVFLLKD